MNFLSYLPKQDIEALSWALLPFSLILVILGTWEIVSPFVLYKKTTARYIARQSLPAAPHIYHLTFTFQVEGNFVQATTRDTYDDREARRFGGERPINIYYRKKAPAIIRTDRVKSVGLGITAFLIGAVLLTFDLWLFEVLDLSQFGIPSL